METNRRQVWQKQVNSTKEVFELRVVSGSPGGNRIRIVVKNLLWENQGKERKQKLNPDWGNLAQICQNEKEINLGGN